MSDFLVNVNKFPIIYIEEKETKMIWGKVMQKEKRTDY